MKKIITTILLVIAINDLLAQNVVKDSMTRQQFIHSQTVKADTLNMMALNLAKPDADKGDLNKAIDLIMKGLHTYSRYRDTVGMRETFDHLAFVYNLQKKFIQAKWFYIQSNTLSCQLKDTANIINSLISLSAVKAEMKNPDLAEGDLKLALSLAKLQHKVDPQITVELATADFYAKTGNSKRENIANDRISFLKDSVLRANKKPVLAQDKPKANNLQGQLKQQPVVQPQGNQGLITIGVIAVAILLGLVFYFRKKRGV